MAIVGIDLGTTNSLVAIFQDGEPHVIANSLGQDLTPSAVSIDDDGAVLVGQAAAERRPVHASRTATHFKRSMGTDRRFTLDRKDFRAEDLSAFVLRALKEDAEAYLDEAVTQAVISVPAYFNDAQRKATKAAGELAGLKVERLINEPTAAAVAYGLHQREAESKFLVFDLGGGTFDVSILELFEGIMEVHASAGDAFLGGEDFVDLLIDTFLKEVDLPKQTLSAGAMGRVRNAVEAAKIELSRSDSASVTFRNGEETHRWQCSRDRFAELSKPLLDRLWNPVQRAMRDARLASRDLDAVLLVGGATRTPMVRSLVGRMLGQLPSSHLDPDKVVAMGAAIHAAMAAEDAALEDRVLTDVAPFTLGIETSMELERKKIVSGRFAPIIERNTLIPASRSEQFSTVENNQTVIEVPVYQGESRLVTNNVYLGKMEVSVPRMRAGEAVIDVRFTYDVNGILEVEVTVEKTGVKKRLVIEGNPGVMTQEQIEARFKELAPLKLHPRENMENRTMLARAERLYEEALGELREFIAEYMRVFETALGSQDPAVIDEARSNLSEFLDDVEQGWADL